MLALVNIGRSRGGASPGGQLSRSSAHSRIAGVDVARGLAVIGMYAVHVGPHPRNGGIGDAFTLFQGRSSALFAVLAGLSLSLLAGAYVPRRGVDGRKAAMRIAVRVPILFFGGLALNLLGISILVILPYYAMYFVLSLPLLRWRARTLAIGAGVMAVVGPVASYALRWWLSPKLVPGLVVDVGFANFDSLAGVRDGLFALLVNGSFPMFTWMAFVMAGMAVGRLDLRSNVARVRLVGSGVVFTVLGYLGSWLALNVFGGSGALYAAVAEPAAQAGIGPAQFIRDTQWYLDGTVPTTSPSWLLVSLAHSGTPFDIIGSTGAALLVIGLSLMIAAQVPKLVLPVAAVGSMALTAYVGHLVVISLLWGPNIPTGRMAFFEFVVVALVLGTLWRIWLGRGPLERLLHIASVQAAQLVKR